MAATNDAWSQSIRDVQKLVRANIQNAGELAEELWLGTTRIQMATKRAPAPRSTWLADTIRDRNGVTVIIGWNNFKGSDVAANIRFTKAQLHYDALLTRMVKNFELMKGV